MRTLSAARLKIVLVGHVPSARLIFDLRDEQPEAFAVAVALALALFDEAVDVGDAGADVELIRRLLECIGPTLSRHHKPPPAKERR